MKSLLLMLGLIFLLTPVVSSAAEAPVRGKISEGKRLPIYTDDELEEALKASDACSASGYDNLHYDCSCVGRTFLELRRKKGESASRFWLNYEAQRKCPNAPAIAGETYTDCLRWAPQRRGEDYDEFCACYGSNYAKLFTQNPSDSLLVAEAQKTKAMEGCNVNAPNVIQQERETFVRTLKEKGTYEKLFPSAAPPSGTTSPAPAPQSAQ